MPRFIPFVGAAMIALAVAPAPARAVLVDVDFGGGPLYSGAAVLGSAGDIFNSVSGPAAGTNIALNDSTGAGTGITLSYLAAGFFDASNIAYTPDPAQPDVTNLLRDYLFVRASTQPTGTVTLGGLTPNANYDLVAYSIGNGGGGLSTDFTVDGGTMTAANPVGHTFGLVNGQDYVVFSGIAADASGHLVITFKNTPGNNSLGISNFNGFQLQNTLVATVPEPASAALLAASLLALGAARRRRKAA